MAKKAKDLTPKYYVHYDRRTGNILCVGNEINPLFENYLQFPYDDVEPFLESRYKFADYLIGYKKTADGKTQMSIVQREDQGYAFKNNLFEWITETDKETECLVEWNNNDKAWYFSLDPASKKYLNEIVLGLKVIFFVTLETDFDFLIRTIPIDVQELAERDRVQIPWTTRIEQQIDKISISSKIVFKSYGLRIVR